MNLEVATLGGGCFWCLEAVFQRLRGVQRVVSGYSGGLRPNPSYEQVCSGATGHAEVVQITFDPGVISFRQLLEIFWMSHDPTTLNRQGADVGTQYRSVVFYQNETQLRLAEEVKSAVERAGFWKQPIVTEISPLSEFYPAEDYHQNYFNSNRGRPYCQFVIEPKLEKAVSEFGKLMD